ncbi:Beta,beta-carotene 9',10'-oxygenase [Gonapodya sp. JEL0774]|nr:Beta,beta-carotene 9',10'-oxygenase [Gonapodya sp. JEL0774]
MSYSLRGASLPFHNNVVDSLSWHGGKGADPTVFAVVKKDGGGVVGYWATEPEQAFYGFHTINGYEDGSDLVLDLCAFPPGKGHTTAKRLYLDNLRAGGKAGGQDTEVTRCRLRNVSQAAASVLSSSRAAPVPYTANPRVECQVMCGGVSMELPRVDPRKMGKRYRYAWGVGGGGVTELIKVDLDANTHTVWSGATATGTGTGTSGGDPHDPRTAGTRVYYPSEPVYLPRPGGTADDDGVLVSVVMDGGVVGDRGEAGEGSGDGEREESKSSFVAVLDAASMKEVARAWVVRPSADPGTEQVAANGFEGEGEGKGPVGASKKMVPHIVPFGFHGSWVGEDGLVADS